MDVAHHMNYLAWMEIGRTEWMRAAGSPYVEIEEGAGLRFPVREVGVKYVRPARYDDRIIVRTRAAHVDRLRVRFEYEVRREADGIVLAEAHSVHVCTGRDGRPTRMPRELAARLGSR
jgi:acyl-CoA thioester hydrolase